MYFNSIQFSSLRSRQADEHLASRVSSLHAHWSSNNNDPCSITTSFSRLCVRTCTCTNCADAGRAGTAIIIVVVVAAVASPIPDAGSRAKSNARNNASTSLAPCVRSPPRARRSRASASSPYSPDRLPRTLSAIGGVDGPTSGAETCATSSASSPECASHPSSSPRLARLRARDVAHAAVENAMARAGVIARA